MHQFRITMAKNECFQVKLSFNTDIAIKSFMYEEKSFREENREREPIGCVMEDGANAHRRLRCASRSPCTASANM